MTGLRKAENAQGFGRSVFELAIVRMILLAGALQSARIGWVVVITRMLDIKLRDLFAEPVLTLLPWLLAAMVSAFLLYWLGVRLLENREVRELAPGDALRYLPPGVIGGFILFGVVIFVLWAQDFATFQGYAGSREIPTAVLVFAAGVVFEELIYRGAIFRIVEESVGTAAALAFSALLFGLSHLGNNAATLASVLSIAVAGGIVFGLSYTLTRSLWLPIGIHFGWNFTQGALLGTAVSGYQLHGAFRLSLSGPVWATGGAFGPEASIYTTVFGIVFALGLGELARRRGLWIPLRFRFRLS